MAELYLKRTLQGFAAHDDAAREYLRKVKLGDVVKCEIIRPRSVKYHRRFFGMLNTVWQACGDWQTVDELLTELKFRAGLVDKQRVIDKATGEVLAEIIKPRSISFAAMSDDEFREFVDRCIAIICTEMIPGLDDSVLRDEVLRAVA